MQSVTTTTYREVPTVSAISFSVSADLSIVGGDPAECEPVPARPGTARIMARRDHADAIGRTVCLVDGRWVRASQVRAAGRAWERANVNYAPVMVHYDHGGREVGPFSPAPMLDRPGRPAFGPVVTRKMPRTMLRAMRAAAALRIVRAQFQRP